jgi:hypothetical protein
VPALPVRWCARTVPLPACALLVRGQPAQALGRRLLEGPPERLAPLRGCAADDLLVLLGEETALPWIDGAHYLGRDPDAPALLVPTCSVPDVPMTVFAEAVSRQLPRGEAWAIVPAPGGLTAVAIGAASPIAPARLQAWLVPTTAPARLEPSS